MVNFEQTGAVCGFILSAKLCKESRFVERLKLHIGDLIKGALEMGFSTSTVRSGDPALPAFTASCSSFLFSLRPQADESAEEVQ